MRTVIIVLYGLINVFYQCRVISNMLMVKEPVLQLFISGFDHGVGEFYILLGDQVSNDRMGGGSDPVFYCPGIL